MKVEKENPALQRFLHPGKALLSGVDSMVLALDLRWRGDKFFQTLEALQQQARARKCAVPGQLQTKDQAHALMYEVLEHGADG